jgi:phosphate transport system permease protein
VTAVATEPHTDEDPPDLRVRAGAGPAVDRGFRVLALGGGLTVLAILAGIAISTTSKAWPAFRIEGLSYFFSTDWDPINAHFGAFPFIYGTLVVSAIALILAVPVSIGIALFITELAPRRIRSSVITVLDLMAAVPSVVFGLWGLLVLAPHLNGVYDSVSSAVSGVPVLNTLLARGPSGQSYFTAGLVLALMITPIITSLTREVFRTVPRNDKEGALALGATRWEMITGVVFPHSTGGMVGAVMLGLGRAMGETIAVALLIGGNARVFHSLFGPGDSMPSVIARNLGDSSIYPYYREALIGLGVTLFAMTILVNIAGRRVVGRLDKRLRGAS